MKRIVGCGPVHICAPWGAIDLEIDLPHLQDCHFWVVALRFVTNQPEHCKVESIIINDRIDRVNTLVAAFDRVRLDDEDPKVELAAQRCFRYVLPTVLSAIATAGRRITVRIVYYVPQLAGRVLDVAVAVEGNDAQFPALPPP